MAEHHEDADIELAGPRLRLLACAQENDVAGVARILQQHPELRDARSDKGVTAVHEAAQRGSLAVLALLRDCGARLNIPNVEWMTPLMVALLHGQGAAVSLLLEACPAAVAGRNGAAVLGLCVQLGLPEPFLRQLHAAGAQPDAVGRWGGTPLHMAAERGSAAAVRQLLKLKERVDVDVPDCEGWTPLHLAAGLADKRACSAIVATLLHAGANPEARTANGHRPLDVSRAGDTAAVALLERKTAAQPASAILSPVAGTAAEAAEQPAGAVPLALVSSPQLGPPTPAKVPKAAAIEAAAAGDGEDMPAAAPALPPCLTVSAPVLAAGSAICGSGSSSSSADDAPAAVVATAEMAAEAAPPLPSTPAVSTGSAGSGSSSSNSQPQQQGPLTVAVGQQHGLSAAESARLKAEAAMAELVEEEERENQWKAQQQQKQQDAKKNAAQRKAEQQAANAAAKAKLMAEAEAAGVAEAQAAELAKSEAARRRQEGEEQRMQQGYESLLAASQAAEETEQQAAAAAAAAAAELNADQQPADGQQAEAAAPAAAQPPAAQHAQQGKPRWQPKAASPQPELMPEQRPAISAVEQPRQQQQPWHSPPSAAGWGAAQQAPAVLPAAVLVQAQQGSWPTATEQQEDAAAIQASMASAGTAAAQQQAGPWQLVGGHCGERLEQPAAEAVAEARGKVPQGLGILAAEQPSASPHVPPPPAAAALAELEDELLRRAIEASLDRSQDVVPSQVRQDAARAAAAAAGGSSSGTAGAAVPDGMGGFTALRNEAGEYNCFLNVLVQCLWHCPEFRQQVSQWGPQIRAARPIASALHSLFEEFKAQQESGGEVSSSPGAAGAAGAAAGSPAGRSAPASPARPAPPFAGSSAPPSPPNAWQPGHKPAWLLAAAAAANGGATLAPVDPAPLREVLAQLPGCKFAQGEMHDASEVLLAIYEAVMEAERQVSAAAAAEGGTAIEKIFGLKVQEEVHCSACKKASHQNNYTQYFCMAQGITLRMLCGVALTMGSLLREAADQDVKSCDTDLGGCGRPNSVNHFLQRAPRVFTLHLCWTTHNEEPADIAATLAAVDETVDLGEVYRGVDRGVHRYTLRSMVCYYGKRYQALVWSPGAASEAKGESGAWLMFDDARVSRGVNFARFANNKRGRRTKSHLVDLLEVPTHNMPLTGSYKEQVVALKDHVGGTEFLLSQNFNSFAAPNFQFGSANEAALMLILCETFSAALEGRAAALFCREYRRPRAQPYPWNSLVPFLSKAAERIASSNAGTAELARDAMRFVSWQRGTLKCNGMWEPAVDIELTEEERTRLAAMFPPGHQLITDIECLCPPPELGWAGMHRRLRQLELDATPWVFAPAVQRQVPLAVTRNIERAAVAAAAAGQEEEAQEGQAEQEEASSLGGGDSEGVAEDEQQQEQQQQEAGECPRLEPQDWLQLEGVGPQGLPAHELAPCSRKAAPGWLVSVAFSNPPGWYHGVVGQPIENSPQHWVFFEDGTMPINLLTDAVIWHESGSGRPLLVTTGNVRWQPAAAAEGQPAAAAEGQPAAAAEGQLAAQQPAAQPPQPAAMPSQPTALLPQPTGSQPPQLAGLTQQATPMDASSGLASGVKRSLQSPIAVRGGTVEPSASPTSAPPALRQRMGSPAADGSEAAGAQTAGAGLSAEGQPVTGERDPQRVLPLQPSPSEATDMAVDEPSSVGTAMANWAAAAAQQLVTAVGMETDHEFAQQCAERLAQQGAAGRGAAAEMLNVFVEALLAALPEVNASTASSVQQAAAAALQNFDTLP